MNVIEYDYFCGGIQGGGASPLTYQPIIYELRHGKHTAKMDK